MGLKEKQNRFLLKCRIDLEIGNTALAQSSILLKEGFYSVDKQSLRELNPNPGLAYAWHELKYLSHHRRFPGST